MNSKPPMTADEAREVVREMRAKTAKRTRIAFWRRVVETGVGNLSDEARAVYAEALAAE